ncbi:hypothetical protein RDI58_030042 [Solanum bulbocastanum]|uniref:Uncharacterized protein n=1 Tax=Solanum bulbocastanum TaxID=147425 RepID=A0AAN8SYU4_SOLBU
MRHSWCYRRKDFI